MKVLIACEHSGVVALAFAIRGHYAVSCDLLPSEGQTIHTRRYGDMPKHHQGDVRDLLDDGWDLMIAHPPCTYLCSSGLHWNKRVDGRAQQTEEALEFVRTLMDAPIPRIAIENPVGCIGTRIRPADQYIQPFQFGHDASKRTGLWLKNLPPLVHTKYVYGRLVGEKLRWGNQTDSGQNRLPPSKDRWKQRSETYQGIADAMAEQWGSLDVQDD